MIIEYTKREDARTALRRIAALVAAGQALLETMGEEGLYGFDFPEGLAYGLGEITMQIGDALKYVERVAMMRPPATEPLP